MTLSGNNRIRDTSTRNSLPLPHAECRWGGSYSSFLKSGLAAVLVLLLVSCVFAGAAAAVTPAIQEHGVDGGIAWYIAEDGTLTISPAENPEMKGQEAKYAKGEMKNYDATGQNQAPWYPSGSSLTKLVIGDGVTTIGDYAFYGCSGFRDSLTIGSGVTTIGDHAFYGCSGFRDSLTIPDGVTTIGDHAFYGCRGITKLTIGSGVTTIGDYAFSGCGLQSPVTIPSGVTIIGSILGGQERTGYTFRGWYVDEEYAGEPVSGYEAGQTYYPKLTVNTYTVILTPNDDSAEPFPAVTATYGEAMPQVSTPTKSGYTFNGYFDERSGGTQYYKADGTGAKNWDKTEDTTLYAQWTAKTYNITYKLQGGSAFSGTHEEGYPSTHTYGTATQIKGAAKTGYTFDGWFKEPDCSGETVTTIGATDYTDDITLYAKWTAIPRSSSTPQGSSVWLTAAPTPTATPAPAPTGTPTPEIPVVKPVASETPAGKSPVPLAGILAGLGCAAVLFGLRRK